MESNKTYKLIFKTKQTYFTSVRAETGFLYRFQGLTDKTAKAQITVDGIQKKE